MSFGKIRNGICALIAAIFLVAVCFPVISVGAETESVSAERITGWYITTGKDFYQCDVYFSAELLKDSNGATLSYGIMDKENYKSLQDYITVNGIRVSEINQNTDTSGYVFSEFPSGSVAGFNVPVVIYCPAANKMQIRIHTTYVGIESTGVRLGILQGFSVTQQNGTAYTVSESKEWNGASGVWKTDEELEAEKPQRDIDVGYSVMQNWAQGGDAQEWLVCDLYFSRDVFISSDGGAIGYHINDGKGMGEDDFTFVLDYLSLGERTLAEINAETDITEYEFHSFPQVIDGKVHLLYAVPVLVYSDAPSHFQIRLHKQYVADELSSGAVTLGVSEGMERIVSVAKESGGSEKVRYKIRAATFTKGDGETWSCSIPYEKYVEPEEIIDRAEIDFSKIDYFPIRAASVSEIISYGPEVQIEGTARKAQFVCVYFDKPISYQYIPYVNWGKKKLSALAPGLTGYVNLTQKQIDAIYDYRIDIAFNKYVKLDGLTISERKGLEMTNADSKIYVHLMGSSADPCGFTLYLSADSASWLDSTQRHTLEISAGFVTPLFGKTTRDYVFYYDPATEAWSETDYSALEPPVYDWSPSAGKKSGANALAIGLIAGGCCLAAAGAAVGAVLLFRRRKENKK